MTYQVQGSNDGKNFENLTEEFKANCYATNTGDLTTVAHDILTEKEYSYYRLVIVGGGKDGCLAQSGVINFYITNIQFLDADTEVGELTSSLGNSENNIWANLSYGTRSEGQYFQYYCGTPRKKVAVQFTQGAGAGPERIGGNYVEIIYQVQGSNDGTNFENLTEEFTTQCLADHVEGDKTVTHQFTTEKGYSYYRLVIVRGGKDGYLAQNGVINYYIQNIKFLNE